MIGNKVFIVLSSILALSLSSPIFFIIYVNGKKKKKKKQWLEIRNSLAVVKT
jgi:hypothetical protein